MESRTIALMNLLIEKKWRPDVEDRLVGTAGEGEGGTNGESGIGICTPSCVNDNKATRCSRCITQGSQLILCDVLEGWDGGGSLWREGVCIYI